MNSIVNLRLLSHPMNWITVALWLIVIGFIVHQLDRFLPTAKV